MELHPISKEALDELRARDIQDEVCEVIALVVGCLDEVCRWVAEDCGHDRCDDANSEGHLRWRRARNLVARELREQKHPSLRGAVPLDGDNGLQIRQGDCLVSFYSARDGVESPDLSGSSKTKQLVVSDMQLQLPLERAGAVQAVEQRRLVVLYEADGIGLRKASVGVLESASEWGWEVSAYDRELQDSTAATPGVKMPSYDAQPEPEIPLIELRRKRSEDQKESS